MCQLIKYTSNLLLTLLSLVSISGVTVEYQLSTLANIQHTTNIPREIFSTENDIQTAWASDYDYISGNENTENIFFDELSLPISGLFPSISEDNLKRIIALPLFIDNKEKSAHLVPNPISFNIPAAIERLPAINSEKYHRRPDVKEKRKKYKEEYYKIPQNKRRKEEYQKEYHQKTEIKEKEKIKEGISRKRKIKKKSGNMSTDQTLEKKRRNMIKHQKLNKKERNAIKNVSKKIRIS